MSKTLARCVLVCYHNSAKAKGDIKMYICLKKNENYSNNLKSLIELCEKEELKINDTGTLSFIEVNTNYDSSVSGIFGRYLDNKLNFNYYLLVYRTQDHDTQVKVPLEDIETIYYL